MIPMHLRPLKKQFPHLILEDNLKIELENIQELTNEYVNKLNQIQDNKEKEILE